METRGFFPLLIVLSSLILVVLVLVVFFVPSWVGLLPWAGLVAGVIAVLQAANLRNAAPAVRGVLLVAGLFTIVLMAVVATRG